MIYAAKPQRGGRSIQANTNNPPQDPPPPPGIPLKPTEVFIPIENNAPPVPEICIEEPIVIEGLEITSKVKSVKVSWIRRLVMRIQSIFRRK